MTRRSALAAMAGAARGRAGDWPQWRGPHGGGVSDEQGLPVEWSATKNIAWKTKIPGRGHSSPVVLGKRLFLTTSLEGEVIPGAKAPEHRMEGEVFVHPDSTGADRRHTLKVLCLDAVRGAVLWERTAYEGRVFDARHKKNTYATPTPAAAGNVVYASFESQGVYAYSLEGKPLWKASPGGILTVGMGPATSPVLDGGLLFLQCDQDEGQTSFVAAISTKNGEIVWKTPRKNQAGWSTPVVIRVDGKPQLVTVATEATIAYELGTGKELWRGPGVEGNAVPSAVVGHGMVYVTSGYPVKRALALKPGGAVAWRYEKGTAYVPSPVLYGDYLYLVTDKGLLTCLDARTGRVEYEGGRVPKPASFSASPVAYAGRILLTSEEGETFVVRAGPNHEVLGSNELGEPVLASLAAARGSVYIRGVETLYCVRAGTPGS